MKITNNMVDQFTKEKLVTILRYTFVVSMIYLFLNSILPLGMLWNLNYMLIQLDSSESFMTIVLITVIVVSFGELVILKFNRELAYRLGVVIYALLAGLQLFSAIAFFTRYGEGLGDLLDGQYIDARLVFGASLSLGFAFVAFKLAKTDKN